MIKAYESAWDSVFDTNIEVWYYELEHNHLAVDGNKDFDPMTCDLYDKVKDFIDGDEVYDIIDNDDVYLEDYLKPVGRDKYTMKERTRIQNIARGDGVNIRHEDDICEVLSIVTGRKWEWKTIRGCSPSEWNTAYYDSDLFNDLTDFERRYFGTGSEWKLVGDDGNEMWHYTTRWDTEDIRAELYEITGEKNIQMFAFDGYVQTPKYREV